MIGGAAFMVAGLLTQPPYIGNSTTIKKPFFQQGGRTFTIIGGSIMLTTGLILSIPKKRSFY
jgi:hypothetical protein